MLKLKSGVLLLVVMLIGFLAAASTSTTTQPASIANHGTSTAKQSGEFELGNAIGSLRMRIQAGTERVNFVDGGGLGESITIRLHLSTKDGDRERLGDINNLGFSAQPSLFRIIGGSQSATEAPVEPTSVVFRGSSSSSSGSEWHYGVAIPLYLLSENSLSTQKTLQLRVVLNEDILKRILDVHDVDETLTSNTIAVQLSSRALDSSSFTQRLSSLRKGLTSREVRRIIGHPRLRAPVESYVKTHWPDCRTYWEYENPDLKDTVPPKHRKVTLYFDAKDRLIAYAEAIFGC